MRGHGDGWCLEPKPPALKLRKLLTPYRRGADGNTPSPCPRQTVPGTDNPWHRQLQTVPGTGNPWHRQPTVPGTGNPWHRQPTVPGTDNRWHRQPQTVPGTDNPRPVSAPRLKRCQQSTLASHNAGCRHQRVRPFRRTSFRSPATCDHERTVQRTRRLVKRHEPTGSLRASLRFADPGPPFLHGSACNAVGRPLTPTFEITDQAGTLSTARRWFAALPGAVPQRSP